MNPGNQNILKERVAPGIWIDANDCVHWSIPELLALVDLPDTQENRARVQEMLRKTILAAAPEATLVYREKP